MSYSSSSWNIVLRHIKVKITKGEKELLNWITKGGLLINFYTIKYYSFRSLEKSTIRIPLKWLHLFFNDNENIELSFSLHFFIVIATLKRIIRLLLKINWYLFILLIERFDYCILTWYGSFWEHSYVYGKIGILFVVKRLVREHVWQFILLYMRSTFFLLLRVLCYCIMSEK